MLTIPTSNLGVAPSVGLEMMRPLDDFHTHIFLGWVEDGYLNDHTVKYFPKDVRDWYHLLKENRNEQQ